MIKVLELIAAGSLRLEVRCKVYFSMKTSTVQALRKLLVFELHGDC